MQIKTQSLRRNAGWMLIAQGAKLGIQAIYFILMARSLGPQQYGSFVAVTAVTNILVPFVGNGTGSLMIKHVARNRTVLHEWVGNCILVAILSGLLICLLLSLACWFVLPSNISWTVILLVIASDALAFRFVDVAQRAFQSVERLDWTANLDVLASLGRLFGITIIILLRHPTVIVWSVAYFLTNTMCAVVAIACVIVKLGWPEFRGFGRVVRELQEGFYFSASLSAQTVYNDIDKTMLARMATLDATGIYAAAYRLIDVAFIPVRSLLFAAYPTFFRNGQEGIFGTISFTRRLLPKPVAYSAMIAAGLAVAAPMVPHVLGHEYAPTIEALRWLALLPLLKTMHYFAADSLTGAGYQGVRTLLQILVAVFNVLINLWLIPAYSWRGAAWSSLASDALLVVSLWLASFALIRRETGEVLLTDEA